MAKKNRLLESLFLTLLISCLTNYLQAQQKLSPVSPAYKRNKIIQDLDKTKSVNLKKVATMQFQYFVTRADSSTFGYSIFANGNLYIQQNTIPAIPGNKGFADTASAGKIARLAIKKIKQGELPPTISINELKKVGIQ
jgi:hypothetical protein